KELEGTLVGVGGAFEVEPDLEPAVTRVVPDLVMELGPAVVKLGQAAVAAGGQETAPLGWELGFHALPEAGEEVPGRQDGSACQRPEYSCPMLLPMAYIPTVTENEGGNRERSFGIYSRLLKDRIILIGRPIDDVVSNLVVAQLIYLAADDPEKEIQIYVNSPGGAV